MKIALISLLCSQFIYAFSEGQEVYVCLKNNGSCKAVIKRIGSETIKVKWIETCEIRGSFLGIGDIHKNDTEWIPKHTIESWASSCK